MGQLFHFFLGVDNRHLACALETARTPISSRQRRVLHRTSRVTEYPGGKRCWGSERRRW